jgi:hypothetical protein
MCYILCTTRTSVYVALGARRGVRGGWEPPFRGFRGGSPLRILGFFPPNFCFLSVFVSIFGWFFGTWFFADGFLFPVKELGLLTNPGHWIRVLDAIWLLYVYCIVNNVCVNEYRICWFSRFGFPGKNICVMCVFSIVSFLFFY